MNTVISYINLLSCILWLIFVIVNFPPWYFMLAWKNHEYSTVFESLLVFIVLFSSIYLFFARRWSAGWHLAKENEILVKRIEQFELKDKLNTLQEGPSEI